jgi:anti-sigma factor RsiW
VSCDPEKVTAFVDGALDSAEAAEVEAHVAACPSCREQAEVERDLRARLRALPAPEPRSGFEPELRRRLGAPRPGAWRFVLPIAAVLALVAFWGRSAAPLLAWELARDHRHCFGRKALPAEVWSESPAIVMSWFEARGTEIPLVPQEVAGLELVGARYCTLLDRKVAHLYYVGGNRRLSVFVVPGSARFGGSYGARSRGIEVRLLRVSGTTVGITSERADMVNAFEESFRSSFASRTLASSPAS